VVEEAKALFEYVLVDSPAGIEHGFRISSRFADRAVVVTVPEVPSIRDVDRVVGLLENYRVSVDGVVVNRLNQTLVRQGNMLSPQDILDLLEIPLLGVVPEDTLIVQAVNQGDPLVYKYPNSAVARAYTNIAHKLLDPEYVPQETKKSRGFWSLFGFLRGEG